MSEHKINVKTMPKIMPEVEAFARIKVVGVGGSGTNAVTHMVNSKVRGVEFIAMNTDAQHLHHSAASKKVHIGKNITRGLGTGMDPEIGHKAAEESIEEIQNVIKGADMVFVTAGMGGGTGTGAAPVVAKIAKDQGALTIAVVTKPFFFEGKQRQFIADQGLEDLRKEVDAIVVIPNDRLLSVITKDTTAINAFAMCDEILRQAVEGISNIITIPGIINVDFADIRAVMLNAGSALMGIGSAHGDNRAIDAAKGAISSPLLDIAIDGAKGVLFTIAGGDDLTMFEVQEAAKIITESIDDEAKVIFGAIRDEKLKKNEVKVTVIACGFPEIYGGKKKVVETPGRTFNFETKKDKAGKEEIPLTGADNGNNPINSQVPKDKDLPPIFKPKTTTPPPAKKDEPEDDDWSSIPAFLRRSRK